MQIVRTGVAAQTPYSFSFAARLFSRVRAGVRVSRGTIQLASTAAVTAMSAERCSNVSATIPGDWPMNPWEIIRAVMAGGAGGTGVGGSGRCHPCDARCLGGRKPDITLQPGITA